MSTVILALGYAGLAWGGFVLFVQLLGSIRLFRHSSVPKKPVSPTLPAEQIPHVTLLRPAKGLEPYLYECLASSFHQDYPADKLTVYFCVTSTDDPAYAVMRRLLEDFPGRDARIFIEDEDPLLQDPNNKLGLNPKIRNLSRAYREAKSDIVWVVDCNVWLAKGVAGRMVDKLEGYTRDGRTTPTRFVHQLPLVVDTVSSLSPDTPENQSLLSGSSEHIQSQEVPTSILSQGGGRLEEMFMATEHAKFYGAINTVGVAPCALGKSNMYRKSQLDMVTDRSRNPILPESVAHLPTGLDHFSAYICEDHLIGDLLWRSDLPGYKRHALVWGDVVIQPVAGMSVSAYIARRVRWLRVRKWTVLVATLIEPGIQSLICCFNIAFGLTTVPFFHERLGIEQTWAALAQCWSVAICLWILHDWLLFNRLHAGYSVDADEETPAFARGTARGGTERRGLGEWLLAWLGRELLALPIWTWAVLLGATVQWRGKNFRVLSDMTVVALDHEDDESRRSSNTTQSKVD